ncbi:MAG: hypothetical protein ACI92Z_000189 [Paracoccaceae bacterium]|jgi:hypothetical protein
MQLLCNQTTRLGISLGEVVLPPLNDLLAKSGLVAADGSPADVLVDTVLSDAYGCRLRVNTVPPTGMRYLLLQSCSLANRLG